MAQPATSRIAAQVYREALPLAYEDEVRGWPLLHYLNGPGSTLAEVEELVYDTDAGPGWSAALDLDRAPARILDWLAQLNGVVPRSDLAEAAYRTYILDAAGRRRGTPASIVAAAQRHLTGMGRVTLVERTTSAYALTVITYTAETPDPALTLADILTQKPAGLVLTYEVRAGQTWGELRDGAGGRSWAEVEAEYDSWEDARDDLP